IAAAYGLYVCLANKAYPSVEAMAEEFHTLKTFFAQSRPTAVNLFWALDRMQRRFEEALKKEPYDQGKILDALLKESTAIFEEDQAMSKAIGEHGLTLFDQSKTWGVMTHCNAGGLATSGYGTALAPLYLGHERGYRFSVYANETRPLLQGSRLTAYELLQAGLDVTVLCDNMASLVMKEGKIDAVIVGADRIAANGDTANKIGTSVVAILAKEYKIPFYVAAPTSTFDVKTLKGSDIVIEQREKDEVIHGFNRQTAPSEVQVYNPAFDVTDAKYISAIITEKGVIHGPTQTKILEHLSL
ncbi:MAG: S-methyl-5-thioribose-1-phosphate isomerase, partial [Spirochaetia bacterium]|nr:S-methyl-5-thioribose-1-phosphate isomerase [Spirochaetia bacterium]